MATQPDETVTDPEDGAAAPPAPGNDDGKPSLSEIEQLAVEQGWKPKDNFSGPEEKWKPARDWLAAEHDISRDLRKTVKGLRDTVDRMASTATKQTERALRQQAEEINARFTQAVENKDTAGAAKAAKEMGALEREATAAAPNENVEARFADENPWYGRDEEATAYAISVSQREARKGKSIPDQLAAVDVAMRKRFPELYGQTRQEPKPQPGVHQPNTRGTLTSKREKGFADLPPEAKEAGRDFAKLFKERHGKDEKESLDQYAKDYFANAAA